MSDTSSADSGLTERISSVDTAVKNMIDGNIKPGQVEELIFEEKFFAKKRAVTDSTGQELKYIEFLDSASDVVDAYKCEEDYKSLYKIMKEKKNTI